MDYRICSRWNQARKLSTKVVSCKPAELKTVTNGKKDVIKGFEIIFEDTVLFPEGGGQPDDRGTVNDIEVLRVTRRGGDAIIFTQTALEPGTEVKQMVNWMRRFDHMQQHSGQHLVTAIADNDYGWKTTSWDLGKDKSFIELDTPKIDSKLLEELEIKVNNAIRQAIPMTPRLVEVDSPELKKVRTRGLPDDHVGLVRIVEIEGIEANMCCGTHVSNLSHLQSIKLLGTEKGKKGKTNLFFLSGGRVLDYLGKSYSNEKTLTGFLKCGPDDHPQAVDRIQKSLKQCNKEKVLLLRELAVLEAYRYKTQPDRDPVLCLHRKEADSEFMNQIANEIGTENALMLLTTGDEKGAGLFLIGGPKEIVEEVGPKIAQELEGKGACKNGRYQGKANKLSKKPKAEEMLREYASKIQTSEQ